MTREWMYKTTALKKYGITENQVESAIERGLVDTKEVPNPHYRNGPPSTLLRIADVETSINEIKEFPEISKAEREKRKICRGRRKVRDKLEFYCPRCKKGIRALRESEIFEECFNGNVGEKEAQRILMIAHYRHEHTGYNDELDRASKEKYMRYRSLRNRGFDYDSAWSTVNLEVPDKSLKIKRKFNEEALKLLKKDGLFQKRKTGVDAK